MSSTAARVEVFLTHYRCRFLLASILLLLLTLPFRQAELAVGTGFFAALHSFVIVAAVYAVSTRRRQFVLSLIVGAPFLIGVWVQAIALSETNLIWMAASGFLFFGCMTTMLLGQVMGGRRVTTDKLFGAATAYLMLGITWSFLFMLVEIVDSTETAFSLGEILIEGEPPHMSGWLYFSFTTLTTLGYGEYVPLSSPARILSVLEAATGVLFTALLVAGLVGQYLRHSISDDARRDSSEE